MGEWHTERLGDVAEIVRETLDPAQFGEQVVDHYSLPAYDAGQPERVRASTIRSHKLRVDPETILVSRLNPHIPRTWFARPSGERLGLASTEFIPLRATHVVDPKFLYNFCRSPAFFQRVAELVTGTTGSHQRAEASAVLDIALTLPPLSEQRAIAEVLGALDDKIEANRLAALLCDNLSRAHFLAELDKERAAGKGNGELLSSLVDHLPGRYLVRNDYHGGGPFKVFGSNSIMGAHREYLYEGPFTVMARIGSNCGSLMWSGAPAWINNNASALRARSGIDPYVLHRLLETIDMDSHRSGSGQPYIGIESLLASRVTVPSVEFQRVVGPVLQSLSEWTEALDREATCLSALRDAILPKLLSGELRVRTAEAMVEEAV